MLLADSSPLEDVLSFHKPTRNSSFRVSAVTASLNEQFGVRRTSLCVPSYAVSRPSPKRTISLGLLLSNDALYTSIAPRRLWRRMVTRAGVGIHQLSLLLMRSSAERAGSTSKQPRGG